MKEKGARDKEIQKSMWNKSSDEEFLTNGLKYLYLTIRLSKRHDADHIDKERERCIDYVISSTSFD